MYSSQANAFRSFVAAHDEFNSVYLFFKEK